MAAKQKKAATPASTDPFAALVDELGGLESELAPFEQKLKRVDAIRKTLRDACPAKATEQWTVQGSKYFAVLGARANQKIIDFAHVVKLIGAKGFAIFATCTVTALETHVTAVQAAACIRTENTGARSLKTFHKD